MEVTSRFRPRLHIHANHGCNCFPWLNKRASIESYQRLWIMKSYTGCSVRDPDLHNDHFISSKSHRIMAVAYEQAENSLEFIVDGA